MPAKVGSIEGDEPHLQLVTDELMRPKVLGHTFEIRVRHVEIRDRQHECVRCLVQQQVPTVVVLSLVHHPKLVADLPPVKRIR